MPAAENHHSDPFRAPFNLPRRTAALAAPLLLLALTVGFYWKLVLTDQYTWLESPDFANQVLPWLQFQAGEWRKGIFPLWDPHLWSGQSLIGQAQPGAAYPLNWVLFRLPPSQGWIRMAYLHWYYVLIHFMAVLFAYWLARDFRCSRRASILAGLVFGLGGYVGTTDWPQMLNGAVWAPLVFLFLRRALEGVRPLASAALSGLFLGVSWLSGHHQIPIYTSLAACGVWLFHLVRSSGRRLKSAALLAVFLTFALLAGALQILPAYEYGKLARRWVGVEEPVGWNQKVPYLVHAEYSFNPLSILGVVIAGAHRHASPFLGVVGVTLALLALAARFREREVRLLAVVGLCGLAFSLGQNSVFHGMAYALAPLVEKARSPSMAIFIFHFGFSLLTAFGVDRLLDGNGSPWPRRAALALLAFAVLLLAVSVAVLAAGRQPEDRYALAALAALLASGLIYARWRGQLSGQAAWLGLAVVALIELGNVSGFAFPHRLEKNRTIYLNKMAQHADLAEFFRRQPWPLRFSASDADLPYNFGDWYGIDQFGGYVASLPSNLLRLGMHSQRVRNLMGVGYTVAAKPPQPGQREIYRGQAGLNVYENPDALPRVWTVHSLTRVQDDEQARRLLEDPSFDLRRGGWIHTDPPPLEACAAEEDSVRLLRRESNRLELEARMACTGMVVLSENYFPGWRAAVDGRPAPIYEVYTALRGVVVGAGSHRIVMFYRPLSVRLGAAGTALAVLGALLLAGFGRPLERRLLN